MLHKLSNGNEINNDHIKALFAEYLIHAGYIVQSNDNCTVFTKKDLMAVFKKNAVHIYIHFEGEPDQEKERWAKHKSYFGTENIDLSTFTVIFNQLIN